jgi:hypothetical protein
VVVEPEPIAEPITTGEGGTQEADVQVGQEEVGAIKKLDALKTINAGDDKNPINTVSVNDIFKNTYEQGSAEGVFETKQKIDVEMDAVVKGKSNQGTTDIEVSIDDLIPTQAIVDKADVVSKIKGEKGNFEQSNKPLVFEKDGKYYIVDGHNRIAADILKGRNKIQVRKVEQPQEEVSQPVVTFESENEGNVLTKNNGEPIELYHGTTSKDDFTEFDLSKGSKTDEGYLGEGVYLTRSDDSAGRMGKGGRRVLKVNAVLKNPFIFKATPENGLKDYHAALEKEGFSGDFTPNSITEFLKSKGYDGVIAGTELVPIRDENDKLIKQIKYEDATPNQIANTASREYLIFDTKNAKILPKEQVTEPNKKDETEKEITTSEVAPETGVFERQGTTGVEKATEIPKATPKAEAPTKKSVPEKVQEEGVGVGGDVMLNKEEKEYALESGISEDNAVPTRNVFKKKISDAIKKITLTGERIQQLVKDNQFTEEEVAVDEIAPSQLVVEKDNITKIDNKDNLPIIGKLGDNYVVLDGHHRVATNILSGEKTTKARVIDLSKEQSLKETTKAGSVVGGEVESRKKEMKSENDKLQKRKFELATERDEIIGGDSKYRTWGQKQTDARLEEIRSEVSDIDAKQVALQKELKVIEAKETGSVELFDHPATNHGSTNTIIYDIKNDKLVERENVVRGKTKDISIEDAAKQKFAKTLRGRNQREINEAYTDKVKAKYEAEITDEISKYKSEQSIKATPKSETVKQEIKDETEKEITTSEVAPETGVFERQGTTGVEKVKKINDEILSLKEKNPEQFKKDGTPKAKSKIAPAYNALLEAKNTEMQKMADSFQDEFNAIAREESENSRIATQKLNEEFEARQKELEKFIPEGDLQEEKNFDEIERIFDKVKEGELATPEEIAFVNENAWLPNGFVFAEDGLTEESIVTTPAEKESVAEE